VCVITAEQKKTSRRKKTKKHSVHGWKKIKGLNIIWAQLRNDYAVMSHFDQKVIQSSRKVIRVKIILSHLRILN
jgi:hypothetical protein